jgi:hypothetical protein
LDYYYREKPRKKLTMLKIEAPPIPAMALHTMSMIMLY